LPAGRASELGLVRNGSHGASRYKEGNSGGVETQLGGSGNRSRSLTRSRSRLEVYSGAGADENEDEKE